MIGIFYLLVTSYILQFPHDTLIGPLIDHPKRLHQLVHDRPCVRWGIALDGPEKVAIAIATQRF